MKEIKITCEAKELVDIDKIESIQGELNEVYMDEFNVA